MGITEDRTQINIQLGTQSKEVHIEREALRRIEERRKTNKVSDVQVQGNYNRKYCQHLLRATAFLVCMGILIGEAVGLFIHFLEFPTYTSTKIEPQHHADFPALSICPMSNGYKDEVLKVNQI